MEECPMPMRSPRQWMLLAGLCRLILVIPAVQAADQPQWGERYSRNMVSDETGLPDRFDPKTGKNVKWSAAAGHASATPRRWSPAARCSSARTTTQPRDPRHQGDRGVLMCFNEADGSLAWQLVVPKLDGDIYLDWPQGGHVLAADGRRRSRLHGHQSRRGGVPGPARHGQRQRRPVPRRRPPHGPAGPAADGGRPHRCRHPLALGPAHRRPASGRTTRPIARSCWTGRIST